MNLVTGATGLVGSYLSKLLLSKGEKVRAIKRSHSDISLLGDAASQIEWVEADVLDMAALEVAMKGVKRVYHCAAVISFDPREIDHMMKVNVEGTANVMNTALSEKVEKVVHVSSTAAFGTALPGKVIDENFSDPDIGKSYWYFRSKQYGEREAWRAIAEGLPVVIACPSTILGAGWWDDQPNILFKDVYNGLGFYTAAGNGFVDVRDVAECLYRLMHEAQPEEKFLITAENLHFKDLLWMIADALNKKRPQLEAGRLLLSIAWRWEAVKSLFTSKPPLVTRETARLANIEFRYSNEKIKDTLKYQFRPVQQTINETAAAFLHSIELNRDYGRFN